MQLTKRFRIHGRRGNIALISLGVAAPPLFLGTALISPREEADTLKQPESHIRASLKSSQENRDLAARIAETIE